MQQEPWARTVLRWSGSKKSLVPVLISLRPASVERYVEPFAGSAALFFALRPDRALLGDFNAELVHALVTLRRHPRRLHSAITRIPTDRGTYYSVRDGVAPRGQFEQAVRFFYLNRYCFNGVYRTNREGRFNVPPGRGEGKLPSEAEFYRCSYALRHADVRPWDFRRTLDCARKGDFVYVDPPYSVTRPTHGEYGYGSFGEDDMADLVDLLHQAHRNGANVLVSYGYDERLLDSLSQWRHATLFVRRNIAGKASGRKATAELLISNSLPVTRVLAKSRPGLPQAEE